MKEETVSIKVEILPGSTVEDSCIVYVQGKDMKMESKTEVPGNFILKQIEKKLFSKTLSRISGKFEIKMQKRLF